MKLAASRRAEYNFSGAGMGERQSNPVQAALRSFSPTVQPPDPTQAILGPKELKIYSEMLIKAWNEKVYGAYRLFFYCKALDPFENRSTSGRVSKSALRKYLISLGMTQKTIKRWISQALELEIIRYSSEYRSFFMVSIDKAAIKVGCEHIGKASIVSAVGLMDVNNRSLVWASYEGTFNCRPISQATKRELVGVDERTQRNYLKSIPGEVIGNYAHTRFSKDEIQGLNQEDDTHCFVFRGVVYQRLPNIRKVPRSVARPAFTGRRKKTQRLIDKAIRNGKLPPSTRVRGSISIPVRLFCESDKQIEASKNRIRHLDMPDYKRPLHVFKYRYGAARSNMYERIETGAKLF